MRKKPESLADQAMAAMKQAVRGVVEDHRRRNRPLSTWRNGKVVYRDPHNRTVLREERESYTSDANPDAKCRDQ